MNDLNKIMDNMKIYYNIYEKMLNNYDSNNKNYEILKNLNEIIVGSHFYEVIFEINRLKIMNMLSSLLADNMRQLRLLLIQLVV